MTVPLYGLGAKPSSLTQDKIIRMAIECQLLTTANRDGVYAQALERFAALVAAHEAEKWKAENKRDYENWKMAAEKAAECEREACAKVCDDEIKSYMSKQYTTDPLGGYRERFAAEQCAAAIRARGETK